MLARAAEAVRAVRSVGRGEMGELRVGYAPSPTTEILPRARAAFQKAAPRVRVTLLDLVSDDLERSLLDGRVHISVMVKPGSHSPPGILFEEIVCYPLRVAVARQHRFARMAKVPLQGLLDEPFAAYVRAEYTEYYEMLERTFADFDQKPCKHNPRSSEAAPGRSGAVSRVSQTSCGRPPAPARHHGPDSTAASNEVAPSHSTAMSTASSASNVTAQRFLGPVRSACAERGRSPGIRSREIPQI